MTSTSSRGENNEDIGITVGRLVEVASRTWPGINRPGGVARVTKVHEVERTVDVSYMVGRSREKNVPMEYVTLAPHYETGQSQGLRDRSLLLGRCRRCGSLRTDCGSCDWVSEEQMQQQRMQQQQQQEELSEPTNVPPRKSTSTKSEDIQDSSSDSSEDDIALRDLLRTSHKYYKKHLRNRTKWNQLVGAKSNLEEEDDDDNHNQNATQEQVKLNQQHNNIHDDDQGDNDDEEEDVDELWRQSQRRYRRHLRQRAKWQRRIVGKENNNNNKMSNSNPKQSHRSVLETLGSKATALERQQNHEQSKIEDKEELTERHAEHLLDSPSEKSTQTQARPIHEMNDSEAGRRQQNLPSISTTQQIDSDFPNPLESNFPEHRIATMDDDPDAAFIQPEGREAAENLPDDMVDQTKNIPFSQLADFFERSVQDLEDRLVPDISLRLAELQRQERRISSPRKLESTTTSEQSASALLLEQCHDLWNQITMHLIRNGTDQCRAALRRLSDDRLFRKHRHSLTTQQRKQIRSTTLMDARHLRLDALEDSVEALVRKLKTITSALEHHSYQQVEQDDNDNDGSIDFADATEDETADDYETQDLIPIHLLDTHNNDDETTSHWSLGEFDPHQYAYKRRTNKRGVTQFHRANKKQLDGSLSRQSVPNTRKRPKSSHANESLADFIVNDIPTNKGSSSKTKTIRKQSSAGSPSTDEPAIKHPESNLPNQTATHDDHNDDDDNMAFLPDDPETSDDEDDAGGTFNDLVPAMMEERTPHLESDRGIPEVRSKRVRKLNDSSTMLPSQSFVDSANSTFAQRDRVPISQRMQAFLDKNSELHTDDDNIDESDLFESGVITARDHLAQRRIQRSNRTRELNNRHLDSSTKAHPPSQQPARLDSSEQRSADTQGSYDVISVDYLLTEFNGTSGSSMSVPISSSVSNIRARTYAQQIRETFSKDPNRVRRLFQQVQSLAEDKDNDEQMVELHDTLTDLLKRHGTSTLTELIACRSPNLGSHVQLLATLVRSGAPVDGHRQQLLDLLVLQMVDAVFALIHLDGWALKIPNRVGILQLLEPIRSALAATLPLMESVCRCIVEQFGCQEWRVSQQKDRVFVSSIDPAIWKNFVESGEYPSQFGGKCLCMQQVKD
jgi:hypothetical protein